MVKRENIPDCYKNQNICNEAVDSYAHALELVHNCYCYKTQKMCNKTVNTSIHFVPECYKNQEMIDKIAFICPFVFEFDSD